MSAVSSVLMKFATKTLWPCLHCTVLPRRLLCVDVSVGNNVSVLYL